MESDKYSALACLKETQGEPGVMRALMKIYSKMQVLEKSKERRRNRVDHLNGHTDHPSADEFHRKLANAEAQCVLLEEQLVSVRNIIAGFSSDKAEESLDDVPTKLPSGSDGRYVPATPEEFPDKNAFIGTIQGYLQSNASSFNYPISTERKREPFEKQLCNDSTNFLSNSLTDCNQKQLSRQISGRKYHINVKSIPFVSATTSSSKSHSLRANIQTIYSMGKYCNPVLCQAAPLHRKRSLSDERQRPFNDTTPRRRRSNSVSDNPKLLEHHSSKSRHPESEFEIDLIYSRGKSGMSEAQKRKIFLRDLKSVNFYMNKAT